MTSSDVSWVSLGKAAANFGGGIRLEGVVKH
jgi:hypothetical protein